MVDKKKKAASNNVVDLDKERTLAEFPAGDVELLEVVDYKVCLQFSNGALENEVQHLIKNGWKTVGGTGCAEKDGRLHWFQGMVKLADPEIGE